MVVRKLIDLDLASPKRVAIIGDSMTDCYVYGRFAESQDGCQKFVEESRVMCDGGATNAARSLYNWQSEVQCYGNDADAGPIKTRFLVDGRIVFRHDLDVMLFVDEKFRAAELQSLKDWEPDAVLVSDYDKGFLTESLITQAIAYAHVVGIPVVADAKRRPAVYRGALLKCNDAYEALYSEWWDECDDFVLTRGAQLPVCRVGGYDRQKVCGDPFAPLVKCVNHVGAGDCFAAHLALALAHGLSLEEATTVAHSAGRVYVQHPNNRPPEPKEIANGN